MNPRGVRSGIRQLQKYNKALGGGYKLRLELYWGRHMDKKQFKEFCKNEFMKRGFKKNKNTSRVVKWSWNKIKK